MSEASNQLILSRIHPAIVDKLSIWNLIYDSYVGGERYIRKSHLFRYVREPETEYKARLLRSVYFNHVQPIADTLAGLLYSKPVQRQIKGFEYMLEKAHKHKGLDAFMMQVATYSMLYTCGVLVDSPENSEEYATLADRQSAEVNPYCCFYHPNKISDFYVDDEGCLKWIILDNSYIDSCDPFQEAKKVQSKRLWTEEFYQDFEGSGTATSVSEPVFHGLGKVPFIFVNWKDVNEDMIADSPFEDIALISRYIYNLLSYMDEMLASGTFKSLFYPVDGGDGIPADLKNGIGNLVVVPYNGALSQKPFFDGHTLGDADTFIKVFDFYTKQILSKVGLDKDTEKAFAQSGIAKSLEYKKAESLLVLGAAQMEEVEKQIFELAALWEGKEFTGNIVYDKSFYSDDIDSAATRLMNIYNELPYQSVKNTAAKKLVNKVLADATPEEKIAMLSEIDGTDSSLMSLQNKLRNPMLDNMPEEPEEIIPAETEMQGKNQTQEQ